MGLSREELAVHLLYAYIYSKPDHPAGLCFWLDVAWTKVDAIDVVPYFSPYLLNNCAKHAIPEIKSLYNRFGHVQYVSQKGGYTPKRVKLCKLLIKYLEQGKLCFNEDKQDWKYYP